ncbi:hypothetical protein [Actinoallomurus acanthiterrae]
MSQFTYVSGEVRLRRLAGPGGQERDRAYADTPGKGSWRNGQIDSADGHRSGASGHFRKQRSCGRAP